MEKDNNDKKNPLVPDEPVKFKEHPLFNKKGAEHFHGARMSKINPELEAQLQHQANKLRIFKLFMACVLVFALIVTGIAVYRYLQELDVKKKHRDAQIAYLDELEKEFSRIDRTPFQKQQSAAKALRRAKILMEQDADYREILTPRLTQYENMLKSSYPAFAAYGQRGEDFICGSGMLDMVYITNGTFQMGRTDKPEDGSEKNELPRRKVEIPYPFWMARTEVDIWQIRLLIPTFRMREWGKYKLDQLSFPAGEVRWDQAILYCKKLTELERAQGRVPEGYEYRLPTEAEWEYACRAGTDTVYPWGDSFLPAGPEYVNGLDWKSAKEFDWKVMERDNAAKDDKHRVAAPTGSLKPNAWGLQDMLGNVAEWCYDWYAPNVYNEKNTKGPVVLNPVSVPYTQYRPFDDGTWDSELPCRVIRGGSWGVLPHKLRPAYRDYMPPNEVNNGVGFRPVLAPIIKNKVRN